MRRGYHFSVDLRLLYGLCLLLKAVFQRYWCDIMAISGHHRMCADCFYTDDTHRLAGDVRIARYGSVYTR